MPKPANINRPFCTDEGLPGDERFHYPSVTWDAEQEADRLIPRRYVVALVKAAAFFGGIYIGWALFAAWLVYP